MAKRKETPVSSTPVDGGSQRGVERVRLAAAFEDAVGDGEYRLAVIAAGTANGWEFEAATLRDAVERGLFRVVASFVDHGALGAGRSARDIAGVVHDATWDEARNAVMARFRPWGPSRGIAREMLEQLVADRTAGRPTPPVGLSVDVGLLAAGRKVTRIEKVYSADLVYSPAAGTAGTVERLQALNERAGVETTEHTERMEVGDSEGEGPAGERRRETMSERVAVVEEVAERDDLLRMQCQATLEAVLGAAADLPAAIRDKVRAQFAGQVFTSEALEAAMRRERAAFAALVEGGIVQGVGQSLAPYPSAGASGPRTPGTGEGGQRGGAARLAAMWSQAERVEAAFARLMGYPVPEALSDTPRLSGIRELYHLVTGDLDMYGVYNPERALFANGSTSTMASLVANLMNKVIPARAEELGRAGYDWFRRISYEEDFNTLQTVDWVSVGGFGDLPTVAEGAAYTELSWTDKAETSAWTKKGGYIGLTLEMIDRDQTQKVRQIPNMLATAGVRTLSAAVANVFTANSLTGITLSDATALFHSSRGNIDTNTLSAANWDAAIQKMFKITELGSARRLGVRPRYIVVPIELEKTALQIMVSNAEPTSNVFYDNVRRTMAENVVTCPELTSATAWLATADPAISPGVGIGYRFGRTPEVFVADAPEVGSMFTNDELRIKARFVYAVGVIDWRPLYRGNA
ncbi:MAG: Mu-like prophage major head subunit gpT family protein [Anaerolineae bacterium]